MPEAWLNFTIVVLVQLLFFITHAHYEKRLTDVPNILKWSVAVGIVFGIVFDLVIGKFFSVYSYVLGFNAFFLTINGALSFGFLVANTLLMQRARLLHFYLWTVAVGAVYETANYFFNVWIWAFDVSHIYFWVVILFGYLGLATIMALVWHVFFGHKFSFLSNLIHGKTKF